MRKNAKYLLLFLLCFRFAGVLASDILLGSLNSEQILEPKSAGYFLDINEKTPEKIQVSNFKEQALPFIPQANGIHAILFRFVASESEDVVWLKLPNLLCESVSADVYNDAGVHLKHLTFEKTSGNFILKLPELPTDTFHVVYRIKSSYSLFMPLKIMTEKKLQFTEKSDDLIYSMYFGVIIIMSLYNLFVYFSTRSRSFLYYVLYTLTFGLAQFTLLGYFQVIFSSIGFIHAKQLSIVFSGISGIFGILFFSSFMDAKKYLKLIYKILMGFAISYILVILAGTFKMFFTAFNLLNLNALAVGVSGIIGSGYLAYRGNRPARFYFGAWFAFMVALVIFVFTNLGLAPYNNFTKFVLPLGSVIEVSLLSFALADKINVLSKENELLVREQNIILEQQVTERTAELGDALESLKQTQTHLVNSEKMASLGHLTAGIAHEINNPINFISANVSPLRRDIEDYETLMELYDALTAENFEDKIPEIRAKAKEVDLDYLKKEIQTLLSGIDEGARRTAEIVKNLKIFSHIDKAENSYYSVNEGLRSTLQLLSHKLSGIYVREDYGDLPPILCFPGKLNQVFMNILSNAIDALGGKNGPEIGIHTFKKETGVVIEISDNGTGMPDHVIKDIFNPFYTTKDVGSGTGLGLSITLAIIEEHGGDIKVKSENGKGTTFIIYIPVREEEVEE
jgi:signal transduction histidine kinase